MISDIRFSPEIEVEYPDDINSCDIRDYPEDNEEHYMKGWEITEDGSLDNGLEYKPSKNNHLFYNRKTLKNIKDLLEMIKRNGGFVNSNCGLHIHVDVQSFSDEEITNIIKNFTLNQDRILTKFRVHRHRMDSYCHPLPEHLKNILVSDIARYRKYVDESFWSCYDKKYYALNIQHITKGEYNTLEFRLFNGTLDFNTMKKYIFWVLKFVDKARKKQYAKN